MYKIRLATQDDWPHVWRMAQEFYKLTDYPNKPVIDEASTYEAFEMLLNGGFIYLGTSSEVPVAMIGVLYSPFLLNTNYLTATELMWWVDPEHRNTALASHLVSISENTADEKGCIFSSMSSLASSPPVVEKYYEKQGYAKVETTFAKGLGAWH